MYEHFSEWTSQNPWKLLIGKKIILDSRITIRSIDSDLCLIIEVKFGDKS